MPFIARQLANGQFAGDVVVIRTQKALTNLIDVGLSLTPVFEYRYLVGFYFQILAAAPRPEIKQNEDVKDYFDDEVFMHVFRKLFHFVSHHVFLFAVLGVLRVQHPVDVRKAGDDNHEAGEARAHNAFVDERRHRHTLHDVHASDEEGTDGGCPRRPNPLLEHRY